MCGDTEVITADLRHVMNKLQEVGQEAGVSGYEKQYKVSNSLMSYAHHTLGIYTLCPMVLTH